MLHVAISKRRLRPRMCVEDISIVDSGVVSILLTAYDMTNLAEGFENSGRVPGSLLDEVML